MRLIIRNLVLVLNKTQRFSCLTLINAGQIKVGRIYTRGFINWLSCYKS